MFSDPESDLITNCWVTVSLNFMFPAMADRRLQKQNAGRLLGQMRETLFWGLFAL